MHWYIIISILNVSAYVTDLNSRLSNVNLAFDPITRWSASDLGMILVTNVININEPSLVFVIIPHNVPQTILFFTNTSNNTNLYNINVLHCSYDFTSKLNITTLMLTHMSYFNVRCFINYTNTNNNLNVRWNNITLFWPQYTILKHYPWKIIPLIIFNLIQVWIFR